MNRVEAVTTDLVRQPLEIVVMMTLRDQLRQQKQRAVKMTQQNFEIFDAIYDVNLVFKPDCYKLCGDAHCCNFARYKSEFSFLSRNHFQELPLLPGEFAYLENRGYLEQFGEYEHKQISFDLSDGKITYEAIVSPKEGCACNHGTRTTICRLYPLMPQFDTSGHVVGVESVGIYEAIEDIAGMPAACKLDALPFDQLSEFLRLTRLIARSPEMVFHIEAYRTAKAMARSKLEEAMKQFPDESIFQMFEALLLRKRLFDAKTLRSELDALQASISDAHGGVRLVK